VGCLLPCLIHRIAADVIFVAGEFSTAGWYDGTGTNVYFTSPNGLGMDAGGNLYITDGSLIRRLDSTGDQARSWCIHST
jgi:hypothetical protein